MDNTIWLAIGICIGVYITSIRFRVRVNRTFNRFTAWFRDIIERNKKIHKQDVELKRLRADLDNVSARKRL